MKNGLVKKLGATGIISLASLVSGCGAMISANGVMRNNPSMVELGRGIGQLEAAQMNKSEVNQTNNNYGGSDGQNGQRELPRLKNIIMTCNFYKGDVNGNGYTDFQDLENSKGIFDSGEPIEVVALFDWLQGQRLELSIHNENNEVVQKYTDDIRRPATQVRFNVDKGLPPGVYTIEANATIYGDLRKYESKNGFEIGGEFLIKEPSVTRQ